MARAKRNIGPEILEGIREIKRGEHGRVINVPSVSSVRDIDRRLVRIETMAELAQSARVSKRLPPKT